WVELINYGVDAIGRVEKAPWERRAAGAAPSPKANRSAYCPRRRAMVPTPIFDGPALPPGSRIAGPAIIEHPGTTIVVHTGQEARIDEFRHTHIAASANAKGGPNA